MMYEFTVGVSARLAQVNARLEEIDGFEAEVGQRLEAISHRVKIEKTSDESFGLEDGELDQSSGSECASSVDLDKADGECIKLCCNSFTD